MRRLPSVTVAHTPVMPGLLYRLWRLAPAGMIHLHVSCAFTPETVWLYAWLRRRRYVAHVHLEARPSGRAGLLLAPYQRIVLRRVLRAAAAVIVPTRDYAALIADRYRVPPGRITVVANASDHEISGRPRGACGRPRRLLFVGRMSVQKNIPLLLEAVAACRASYGHDLRLSIVGDGELRPAVEAQIGRLGLGGITELCGRLHGAELEARYRDADLLLLTSTHESFGLVLVEAMTKGLPIVGVNIPAVRDVVTSGVHGLLAEPTPAAVAAAVHRLLTDPVLYRAVSASNLARARQYRWPGTVEQLSAVYERAARSPVR